jgi:hypothetical protein
MDEMMATKDRQQLARVTAAMLQMMKPDIGALKKAYRNN